MTLHGMTYMQFHALTYITSMHRHHLCRLRAEKTRQLIVNEELASELFALSNSEVSKIKAQRMLNEKVEVLVESKKQLETGLQKASQVGS
jgi:hypothetical protein